VLAALAFLVLGIAVSMVAFLLIIMPAAAISKPRSRNCRPPDSEIRRSELGAASRHLARHVHDDGAMILIELIDYTLVNCIFTKWDRYFVKGSVTCSGAQPNGEMGQGLLN
jgi:hypothetical protein